MTVPFYMLSPLERHADSGLGAMAESFRLAAETLVNSEDLKGDANRHLPRLFLYRHAIELFLKSQIVLLHKALSLPYGTDPCTAEPKIPEGSKWNPIRRIHSVATLYKRFRDLLADHADEIDQRSKTDWCDVPPELDEGIRQADSVDAGSTFFRYPTTGEPGSDSSKSAWQPLEPEAVATRMANKDRVRPLLALLVLDSNDAVVEAYSEEGVSEHLRTVENGVRQACEILSNFNFGFRMELNGGW